jgi:hypothetical protein
MVENLDIELEEIIEMINIQKEKRNIQLQSFTWRYYTFKYRGQRGVGVTTTGHLGMKCYLKIGWTP